MRDNILRVENLCKYFPIREGILLRKVGDIKAVDGMSFSVDNGETFALVGESGSGKTTMGRTVLMLTPPTSGRIWYREREISKLDEKALRPLRREMQIVFQDPSSSLNPRRRVKDIVAEPLIVHDAVDKSRIADMVAEALGVMELPEDYMYRYPIALSGGEKQRVGIARAIILNPRLIILDEPTSSVDVSVQAKIIALLKRLQKERGLTYLFITHNLALVANTSDKTGVMYLGKFMEMACTSELFKNPLHPYTKALIAVIPLAEPEENLPAKKASLGKAKGEIPSLRVIPSGCRFHTRCPVAMENCRTEVPEWKDVGNGHFVACHLY